MKASPQAQLKLLELAAIDAELGRLAHRRRTLPESAEHERLEARDGQLRCLSWDGVDLSGREGR